MISKRLIIGLGLLGVILVSMYAIYSTIDKKDIIVMIEDQIEKSVHQKVKFGDIEIFVDPTLKAEIYDLVMYQDDHKSMVIKKVVLSLNMDTLLEQRLVVDTVKIIRPKMTIGASEGGTFRPADIMNTLANSELEIFNRVIVEDGTLFYGGRSRAKDISAELEITADHIKVDQVRADVGDEHLMMMLKGEVDLKKADATFNVVAKGDSLKSLLGLMDVGLKDQNATSEDFRFSGVIKANREDLYIQDAKITFDETHIELESVIKGYDLSSLAVRTNIDIIDLDHYLPDVTVSQDINGSRGHMKIDQEKKVRRFAENIKAIRISDSVKIGSLKLKGYELSDVFFKMRITNGKVELDPISFKVYDGKFDGTLIADLNEEEPQIKIEYKIANADIKQVLAQRQAPEIVEGKGNLLSRITTRGSTLDDLLKNAEADIALYGEDLVFKKYDIDALLMDFDKVISIDLVDFTGIIASPLGIVLVNSYDIYQMSNTLDQGGQSRIFKLLASWHVKDLIATTRDVAFKTPKNRVSVKGKIDMEDRQIRALDIAILDKRGCAKYIQKISTLEDGSLEVDDKMKILITPFARLFESGEPCDIYYKGRIK